MAKKKKSQKKTNQHSQLFLQAMLIALVGAAAVFAVIRAGQLRDNVDAEIFRVLGASTDKPVQVPKLK